MRGGGEGSLSRKVRRDLHHQGVTKRCRLSWLTHSALVVWAQMRGEDGSCGVQLYTGAQTNFGDLISYLTYVQHNLPARGVMTVWISLCMEDESVFFLITFIKKSKRRHISWRCCFFPSFKYVAAFACLSHWLKWMGNSGFLPHKNLDLSWYPASEVRTRTRSKS